MAPGARAEVPMMAPAFLILAWGLNSLKQATYILKEKILALINQTEDELGRNTACSQIQQCLPPRAPAVHRRSVKNEQQSAIKPLVTSR